MNKCAMNYTGKDVNGWIVGDISHKSNRGVTYYHTKCPYCGTPKKSTIATIGRSKTCGCQHPASKNNLHGSRIGAWEIKGCRRNKDGKWRWFSDCSCGKEVEGQGEAWFKDRRSCGCMGSKARSKNRTEAVSKTLFVTIRSKNEKLKVPNHKRISINEMRFIHKQNCVYCGVDHMQSNELKDKAKGSMFIYKYNGIDRINPAKGYEKNNVAPCCEICNKAKRAMKYGDFMDWIKRVVNHNKK